MMDEAFEAQVQNLRQQAELLGAEKEQSRIIKLLLETYQERLSDGSRVPSNHNDSLDETIALIKGEK